MGEWFYIYWSKPPNLSFFISVSEIMSDVCPKLSHFPVEYTECPYLQGLTLRFCNWALDIGIYAWVIHATPKQVPKFSMELTMSPLSSSEDPRLIADTPLFWLLIHT